MDNEKLSSSHFVSIAIGMNPNNDQPPTIKQFVYQYFVQVK